MRVLVDSSVWIDHLHRPERTLSALLADGIVCTHPVVIGELACGAIRDRDRFLARLLRLTTLREESAGSVLRLIESGKLWGRGLGWSDVQMLASCRADEAGLWTRDASLRRAAVALKIAQPV